ncbi:hypothetical protein P7K49_007454 [Saguinus oedipus]|uniref:Uncharacterized protein n=1 Tax=Saguinus oedipus TaxID=9490 RepID=A0ABQ9VUX7_SAGOE|nr:hypothetical protein P7K49_007454 [Saguinus oedipus]
MAGLVRPRLRERKAIARSNTFSSGSSALLQLQDPDVDNEAEDAGQPPWASPYHSAESTQHASRGTALHCSPKPAEPVKRPRFVHAGRRRVAAAGRALELQELALHSAESPRQCVPCLSCELRNSSADVEAVPSCTRGRRSLPPAPVPSQPSCSHTRQLSPAPLRTRAARQAPEERRDQACFHCPGPLCSRPVVVTDLPYGVG